MEQAREVAIELLASLGRVDAETIRGLARRMAAGAASIELQEVKLKVSDGKVEIHPLPRLESRELVTDLMLMAGEAVARFSRANGLSVPFVQQSPPDEALTPVMAK